MLKIEDILSQTDLAELRSKREAARECAFRAALPIIGREPLLELRSFMNVFDERIYLLFAELYDGVVGGFYYTKAASETEGYLPDIESTRQILSFLGRSGMLGDSENYFTALPSKIITKISDFAISLQDKDGFFYHPQWGKHISVWRKGRDLANAAAIINETGASANYPLPTERGRENNPDALPEHLKSVDAFESYVKDLNFPERPLFFSGELTSQRGQIVSCGKDYVDVIRRTLMKYEWHWLWQENENYDSVNALVRLCDWFDFTDIVLPNQDKILDASIKAIASEKVECVRMCENPWKTINGLLRFLRKNVSYDELYRLRSVLWKNARKLIGQTHRKVLLFRCYDGGFLSFPNETNCMSKGVKASVPGALSGDVDGACLASMGVVVNMCAALGIPVVPMYIKEDGDVFLDIISKTEKKTKHYKNDDEARDAYSVYEN